MRLKRLLLLELRSFTAQQTRAPYALTAVLT
jgi:hypothetical protein